jgi:acyl-CoA synthetase (AMP-forming)/AMP-acid ligase II
MTLHDKELLSYCEERLARYKIPKRITFVRRLPRNPGGTVMRRALRMGWKDSDGDE